MNIRVKTAGGILLILTVTLIGAAVTLTTEHDQREALDDVARAASTVTGNALTLMRSAKDVAFDVVQVQQYSL